MATKEPLKRPIKPGKRYWDRVIGTIKSPERLLVELITNSTDSYKRLRALGEETSGCVQVIHYVGNDGKVKIEVKDEAEGIPFEKLQTAIEEYGEDTSGLSKGMPVRGTVGVGLKDVGLLMEDCSIITVHDGKLNECIIYREKGLPYALYPKINEPITYQERKKLGIEKNGTIVRGTLPKDPLFVRDFETLYKRLCRHYMLRKINQLSNTYGIILRDKKNRKVLKYEQPEGETLDDNARTPYYVLYGGVNFPIKITIRKADRRLGQSGEFREGGLIVVYNEDAVADCSLFGFDADSYAGKLYGEVEIQAQAFKVKELFDPKKPIIDEKRRIGLDPDHPFVQQLTAELQLRLRKIIESEREARKALRESVIKSREARDRVINKFNAMAREELKEKRDIVILPIPPYWTAPEPPDFFKFYYEDLDIMQHQATVVGLGILPNIVPDGSPITIMSSDPAIQVTPNLIFVDSTKAVAGLIRERINLLGSKCGVRATITAKHDEKTKEMIVNVTENPILNPKDGFAFIPDNVTIPDEAKKKIDLIIALELIKKGATNKVTFASSTPNIHCPSDIEVLPGLNVIGGKVVRLAVPLEGKGVGTKGTVTASYNQREAPVNVEVIERREIKGMFSDFKFSPEDLPVISEYDPETGIITIYTMHPMYKKHKDMGKSSLRVFVIGTIIRTACEAVVREGIKRQSARFPTLTDISGGAFSGFQFISEASLRIEELYHQHGSGLCELLDRCALNIP